MQSTGKGETFVYNDAKRLATYTDKAQVDGTHGNVTGDRIELFLKPGVNELERAIAYGTKGSVVFREGQRFAKGDQLTHTAADDNYMMIGQASGADRGEERYLHADRRHQGDVQPRNRQRAGGRERHLSDATRSLLKTCPPELKR